MKKSENRALYCAIFAIAILLAAVSLFAGADSKIVAVALILEMVILKVMIERETEPAYVIAMLICIDGAITMGPELLAKLLDMLRNCFQ